jgi:L-arabinose transport system permease protein
MSQRQSDAGIPPIRPPQRGVLAALWQNTGMLLVFVALFIFCAVFVPNFLGWVNMKGLTLSVATVGIIACTMLFCLASGDFDLSVGSVVAMSGVIAAVVVNYLSGPAGFGPGAAVVLGIGAGVAAGGAVGFFNGAVIAKLGINALITTLATMQIVRGLSYIVADGKAIGVSCEEFFYLGNASAAGVSAPVWIMIGCFAVFGLLLNRTVFGRNALAIGGNAEAARLAGIAVARTKIIIFTLQGLVAGFAGVILASRMTSGQPTTAQGLELQVISACVLGGVSLTGGVGTIMGVIVGVLIMGTVQNAMNLRNIPPFYQYVASGAILLAAVLIDRLKQKRAA